MQFPDLVSALPPKIIAHSELVAQFRLRSYDMLVSAYKFLFVIIDDEERYHVYTARCPSVNEVNNLCFTNSAANVHDAVAEVSFMINRSRTFEYHKVVEVEIHGSEIGSGFGRVFLAANPHLKNVFNDRYGMPASDRAPRERKSFQEWLSQQPNASRQGRYGPINLA